MQFLLTRNELLILRERYRNGCRYVSYGQHSKRNLVRKI